MCKVYPGVLRYQPDIKLNKCVTCFRAENSDKINFILFFKPEFGETAGMPLLQKLVSNNCFYKVKISRK